MSLRIRLVVLLGSVAVVLGAGVGFAFASIPAPNGTISGCYKTSNPGQGALIVIDSTATCPSGTTPLNWNQTGPQGPAGPSTMGSSGLDEIDPGPFYITVQAPSDGGTVGATVTCPADHPYIVTGGIQGYGGIVSGNDIVVTSYPLAGSVMSPGGWQVYIKQQVAQQTFVKLR